MATMRAQPLHHLAVAQKRWHSAQRNMDRRPLANAHLHLQQKPHATDVCKRSAMMLPSIPPKNI
jgi:hypothetical protein